MCKKESSHSHLERTCQVLGESRLWEESPALQIASLPLWVHRWTPMARLCMRMLPASSSFPTVALWPQALRITLSEVLGILSFLPLFSFDHSYLANVTDNKKF